MPRPLTPRVALLGPLLSLACALSLGCASEPEVPSVTLKGHVVDGKGQPLAGIRIGYYKKGEFAADHAATSASDGAWKLKVPEAFMEPPPGKIFFQTKSRSAMSMFRADEVPQPVVVEVPPPSPRR